ncbi:MAG: cobyric acid synthase [Lachnospiraceae bacterium]|nr:cobyric acid synthase [Lachnospiraceae bacterium]
MARAIMIQGTMSSAGKSLLTAALCRIFAQDGYKVAPFKSQNMALNSYITKEGLEMGRAQVMQAEAAGTQPSVLMNPILLKPTSDMGSQVIVNGEVLGNMSAQEYFQFKAQLIPEIKKAYDKLDQNYDMIVIEGAGSPAEINLKENDIVNMGMAEMVDAPVLLVGDIDRGGVFAQLYGTCALLEEHERNRIKGLIINKFRGDRTLLDAGITMLEEKTGIPVLGVIPYLQVDLEEEDSLTERFGNTSGQGKFIDIAVIRLPHISNFTDFQILERTEEISLRYVTSATELGRPDMIILPGTKNTIADLKWMRQNGLEAAILKASENNVILFGICGGFQMMGAEILDEEGSEQAGNMNGMNFFPMKTVFRNNKKRSRVRGSFLRSEGCLTVLEDILIEGYEIHMGESDFLEKVSPLTYVKDDITGASYFDGACKDQCYGTYIHGIFDHQQTVEKLFEAICLKKGIRSEQVMVMDQKEWKQKQYNDLAESVRAYLDMERIYEILKK